MASGSSQASKGTPDVPHCLQASFEEETAGRAAAALALATDGMVACCLPDSR